MHIFKKRLHDTFLVEFSTKPLQKQKKKKKKKISGLQKNRAKCQENIFPVLYFKTRYYFKPRCVPCFA